MKSRTSKSKSVFQNLMLTRDASKIQHASRTFSRSCKLAEGKAGKRFHSRLVPNANGFSIALALMSHSHWAFLFRFSERAGGGLWSVLTCSPQIQRHWRGSLSDSRSLQFNPPIEQTRRTAPSSYTPLQRLPPIAKSYSATPNLGCRSRRQFHCCDSINSNNHGS